MAQKNVPLVTGAPSANPVVTDTGFRLTQIDWNIISAKGKEHLKIYHWALLVGLKGVVQWLTNLTNVCEVIYVKGSDELNAAFPEWLMEAFCQYTHYDLSIKEHKATVTMVFIDKASKDIKKSLRG